MAENSDFIYWREQTWGLSSEDMCCLNLYIIIWGQFSKCGFLFICGFGVWSSVHESTVYAFTASDFFLVLECFSRSVFMSPMVSIPGIRILILTFSICPKCWGFFPHPSQGVLRRLQLKPKICLVIFPLPESGYWLGKFHFVSFLWCSKQGPPLNTFL